MGIYYTLGACQNNRAFFLATVPMRLLTTAVFWGQNWRAAALWEGIGALLTESGVGVRARRCAAGGRKEEENVVGCETLSRLIYPL
ncbi:hypothetical protein B0T26DRAFT_710896 [Lasiosphaeria miniovina]|uniref:Uncharacterized protein n=1 Tax=Lasiosphaeria miniovina TaxID=1954250 RepID=A0AA40AL04_9PEZI|nr:uncharacterized protein B0T26DRAFT_710896 [Lasiosphaeria miniovina]KAK0717806.1 hypothetical protein B0T26DRAFT_710896 [Lasiosphaeria miniovina]